jgi:hypothetical protein
LGRWFRRASVGQTETGLSGLARGVGRLLMGTGPEPVEGHLETRGECRVGDEVGSRQPDGHPGTSSGPAPAGVGEEEVPWSARLPPNERAQEWRRAYCCPTCGERFSAWLRCLDHLKTRKHVRPASYDTKENLRRMLLLPHRDAPLPAVVAEHFRNPDAPPLPPPRPRTVPRAKPKPPVVATESADSDGGSQDVL